MSIRSLMVLLLCVAAQSFATPRIVQAVDAVVVRPSAWSPSLQAWKAHRASQGVRVAEVDSELGRDGIRAAIQRLAQLHPQSLRYVMLASDVGPGPSEKESIPTFYHASRAMVRFGGDKTIATDNPYADLDGDHIPELAIGRIPADSAVELESMLQRTIDFERQQDYSLWRRDVHIVAGVGGFGFLTDSIIEMTTRSFLAKRIPGWSNLSMTQASLSSLYCPAPNKFSETCIYRLNQGGMFWVYIGHGHVKNLDFLRTENRLLPIMTSDQVPAVNVGDHPPIAVFLACYTGAFDAREDSLAEELVKHDAGPVAAIAASRVSGPYGLAMLSDGLLKQCFEQRCQILGDILLRSKRQLLSQNTEDEQAGFDPQMKLINSLATALSPKDYDLAEERLEHVWQINLIGDPTLRLCHPQPMNLTVPSRCLPGNEISVTADCSLPGILTLELAYPRGQTPPELEAVEVSTGSAAGLTAYQERYQAANQPVILAHRWEVRPGKQAVSLAIPAGLSPGVYCVRSFLQGKEGWQVGYETIRVRRQDRASTGSAPAPPPSGP